MFNSTQRSPLVAAVWAASDSAGERNDCTVKAVSIVTGLDYNKVHAAFAAAGRKPRRGARRHITEAAEAVFEWIFIGGAIGGDLDERISKQSEDTVRLSAGGRSINGRDEREIRDCIGIERSDLPELAAIRRGVTFQHERLVRA